MYLKIEKCQMNMNGNHKPLIKLFSCLRAGEATNAVCCRNSYDSQWRERIVFSGPFLQVEFAKYYPLISVSYFAEYDNITWLPLF